MSGITKGAANGKFKIEVALLAGFILAVPVV